MSQTIQAAIYRGKQQFSVESIPAVAPAPGEVQVRVAYCGICGTDIHVYHGNMDARVGFERVIGHEMSGVVAALGEGVDSVQVGQAVAIRPLDHCGDCPACREGLQHICHRLQFLGLDTHGAFQELWSVPAHTVHVLPAELPLAHAALVEPVAVACHDVRRGRVQAGENALVIGGGPIGMLVAMVARHAGAQVTISEVNPARLHIAQQLGFATINPREQDLAAIVQSSTAGKGADVVFEVSGTQAGVDAMTTAIACRGRIVMVAIHAQKPQIDLFQFFWREIELLGARVYTPEDYDQAIELVSNGAIDAKAMITDIAKLSDIQASFEALDSNPVAMKSLIHVSETLA